MRVGKSTRPHFMFLSDYLIANSYNHLSGITVPVERSEHFHLITSVATTNPVSSSFAFHDSNMFVGQQEGPPRRQSSFPFLSQREALDVRCYEPSRHLSALPPAEDLVPAPPHPHHRFIVAECRAQGGGASSSSSSAHESGGMDKRESPTPHLSSRGLPPAGILRRLSLPLQHGTHHTGQFNGSCKNDARSKLRGDKFEAYQAPLDEGVSTKGRMLRDEEMTGMSSPSLTNSNEEGTTRFRPYQDGSWMARYNELVEFDRQHGHCLVPNNYIENPPLAEWVKRQRYQYKLKMLGEHNSMTTERIQKLEELGFVWNSHDQLWEERLNDLKLYMEINGDCNVPNRYPPDPSLAAWVKRQRRQYRLLQDGQDSSLTRYRVKMLTDIGFFGKEATSQSFRTWRSSALSKAHFGG